RGRTGRDRGEAALIGATSEGIRGRDMTYDSGASGAARGARGPSGPQGGNDWVERVRAATDIVELIGERVPLRRVGRNFMGRCPFHEEKTPSFSVNAERQFYHCFSCKVGGDVFKFV